jgi:hypothetical protein
MVTSCQNGYMISNFLFGGLQSCELEMPPDDRFAAAILLKCCVSGLWNRDVARWCRSGLSVSGPFVRRCLISVGPGAGAKREGT